MDVSVTPLTLTPPEPPQLGGRPLGLTPRAAATAGQKASEWNVPGEIEIARSRPEAIAVEVLLT